MIDIKTLQESALSWGADFFGIADLTPVSAEVKRYGFADIEQYPRALSIGIVLLDPIVDQLPNQGNPLVPTNYYSHCYQLINQRLDILSSRLSSMIQRRGYQAYPILASKRAFPEELRAEFSHKMAAHLAGLGWIGKSCLLVTPEKGPRVRWSTILTDAPLPADAAPLSQQCGDCLECVKICPAHAFTGRAFKPGEVRGKRYDAHKCAALFDEKKAAGELPVCGLCLYVCPFGKK